jgi:hypothetical protein
MYEKHRVTTFEFDPKTNKIKGRTNDRRVAKDFIKSRYKVVQCGYWWIFEMPASYGRQIKEAYHDG